MWPNEWPITSDRKLFFKSVEEHSTLNKENLVPSNVDVWFNVGSLGMLDIYYGRPM